MQYDFPQTSIINVVAPHAPFATPTTPTQPFRIVLTVNIDPSTPDVAKPG